MNIPIVAFIAQVVDNLPLILWIPVCVALLIAGRAISFRFQKEDRKREQRLQREYHSLVELVNEVTKRLQNGERNFRVDYRCECNKPQVISLRHSPNRDTRIELIKHQAKVSRHFALLTANENIETAEAVQL